MIIIHLKLQRGNFQLQALAFSHFSFEETRGNSSFFKNAIMREQVRIRQLVAVALNVDQLDEPPMQKGPDAEINFAQVLTQRMGQLALRYM